MRIVHVLPGLTKGGGEKIAADLANHAANAGNDVTIIAACPADPSLLQDKLHSSVKFIFVSSSAKRKYLKIFFWLLKNWSWLSRQDILHCHLSYGAIFGSEVRFLRKLSRKNRPLVVETYHAVGMPIPKLNRWFHTRLVARRDALALMAEDDYWNRFIQKHPRRLIQIIPNGISFSNKKITEQEKSSYLKRIGVPENYKAIIGTIGMLRPDRQPWRYLPIFEKVAKALGSDIHFLMAGGGSELEHLQSLAKKHGIEEQVHLPGLALDTSLPFSVMDIYISLSIGPITGVSMLEAALANLPVVGIQLFEGYKAKETDWVWSDTDEKKIAEKLIHLVQSPQERATLAQKQREYVLQHHTIDAMADAYYKLYHRAIKKSANKRTAD